MAGPVWDVAVAPEATLGAATYPPYWVSVAARTMRQSDSSTGKQYELDQAQTGESHHVLDNRDAAFSPVNSSSPYSPSVTAFKPLRWRAQYPATVQLLLADQATMGDASGLAAGTLASTFEMGSGDPAASVVVVGDAWQGTRVLQGTIPNATPAGSFVFNPFGISVYPGLAHTLQLRVRVPSGISPQVAAVLSWRDINGNPLSVTSGTTTTITSGSSTWILLTVTGTPPANCAGVAPGLLLEVTASGSFVAQTDGWQLELASSPSTWVQPGTWYPIATGGVERWPQVYDMNGTYGKTRPTVVDAFALLAQVYPLPAFYSDVLALSPDFFFPLDDSSSSIVFRDLTGNHRPAPIAVSPQGGGVIATGQSIGTGAFVGAPGGVVTMTNQNVGPAGFATCSCIELDSVGIAGPPVSGGWTRMIAFNNSGAGGSGSTAGALWFSSSASYAGTAQNFFDISFGTGGSTGIIFEMASTTAGSVWSPPVGSYADANWHLMFVTLSSDGKTVNIYIDGVNVYTNTTASSQSPTGQIADNIGAIVYPGLNQFYDGYNGSVAHVAQFPTTLTSVQISNLYTSWKTGWSGESSGSRYARILKYAGYVGATNLQTGATTSMGPAKDIDGATSALTLLENVVTTESGTHYVDGNGTIRFEARASRYNQLTPVYTFGENTAGGEWPYEDVAFDFDTTRVVGQAQITQFSTNQLFVANSPTTLAPGYRPTFQRTINVTNPQEAVDAANYIASRYQKPLLRVQTIRLHPSAAAGMWPIALSLAISMRVRVMRRAPGAPTIQFDGFIENIKWGRDWDTGEAIVDLQMSPANLQAYWVIAALHATSAASASSGQPSVTLNPLPDAAVNPFTASVCNGLALTLEPGTGNAETLTVQSVSGGTPMGPNGAFLTDVSGWLGSNSATLTQVAATSPPANVPLTAAQIVATQNSTPSGLQVAAAAAGFVAATVYRFEAWVRPSQALTFTTNVDWYTSGSVFISTTTVTVSNVPGAAWTKLATTHTAPATAARGIAYVLCGTVAIGVSFQITAIWIGTSPVVTFTANLAHTHASGSVVCEQLPAGVTDPTTWDSASILGTTTTLSY